MTTAAITGNLARAQGSAELRPPWRARPANNKRLTCQLHANEVADVTSLDAGMRLGLPAQSRHPARPPEGALVGRFLEGSAVRAFVADPREMSALTPAKETFPPQHR